MTERRFVDTNVWIDAVDGSDAAKQARSLEIALSGARSPLVVSVQVLGEFYAVTRHRLRSNVGPDASRAMIARMSRLDVVSVDAVLVDRAIAVAERWNLSYWDSLIIAAAKAGGCSVLLTEDLADGAAYDGVRIENPFRDLAGFG